MAPITRKTHFPLVQTLRGLASLWVVLFHAAEGHHIDRLLAAMPGFVEALVFRAGHYGVPVFFGLSGFVIAHSLRDVPLSGRVFGRFVLRRMIRLDPPYWASMLVVVAFGILSAKVRHESIMLPSPENILAHMAYLQLILGMPEINTVYWTLTYEFQFYLFFAAMLTLAAVLRNRLPHAAKLLWALMYLLALVNAAGGFFWVPYGVFLGMWAAFFAGVLAYKAIDTPAARIAGAILILPMLVRVDPFQLVSAATALLLWLTSIRGLAQRAPLFRGMQFLGLISYSLYLIHNPLTGAAGFLSHRLFGQSIAADVAALGAILVVSIVGAALFWWLIERPAHRWTRKIRLA